MRKTAPIADRFWTYVAKSDDGCWNWIGHRSEKGYGLLAVHAKPFRAHRLSWIIHRGMMPDGAQVLHRCDNPACVRPDHLFLGDNAANHADKIGKNRQRAARGEAVGSARLSADDVRNIRASTEGPTALSRRYSMSVGHIDKIRRRMKWRHID
jgi:hypothetical protein